MREHRCLPAPVPRRSSRTFPPCRQVADTLAYRIQRLSAVGVPQYAVGSFSANPGPGNFFLLSEHGMEAASR